VRYIHLNPLRCRIVSDLKGLDSYAYTGQSVIMGTRKKQWQDSNYVLEHFGRRRSTAQKRYRAYVEEGIKEGRRPDLVGGGLVRSMGGWTKARMLLKGEVRVKGDERILGDSDFVAEVLKTAQEQFDRRMQIKARGIDLESIAKRISSLYNMEVDQLYAPGKYHRVLGSHMKSEVKTKIPYSLKSPFF
jgi:hypothetical protein